jgi:hypothetical protein
MGGVLLRDEKHGLATRARDWLARRLAVAMACAACGDWLLLGHEWGLSLVLFLMTVGGLAAWTNGIRARTEGRAVAGVVFVGSLLTVIEDINLLSVGFAVLGTALWAVLLAANRVGDWRLRLGQAARHLWVGPVRLLVDVLRVLRVRRARPGHRPWRPAWRVWVVPLGCAAAFLALFEDANPLLAGWLEHIHPWAILWLVPPGRLLFWLVIVAWVWPLLHPMVRPLRRAPPVTTAKPVAPTELFGRAAVLRSLVLFNALFAVQTAMDVVYLWGGAALPAGMTLATYAHQGAYPLMVTAVLAAAFVLAAMKPGGPGEASRAIVGLVVAWTGQNILLVVSAMRRLDLYIATYSLTYWRLAALVWMLLVAFGLATIIWRIVRRTPTDWLVTVNAAALALTLYIACFIDFPALIARYNIEHCSAMAPDGPELDHSYLRHLGPSIIPVLDEEILRLGERESGTSVAWQRQELASQFMAGTHDWRSWTFSAWRLNRYLSRTGWDSDALRPIAPP